MREKREKRTKAAASTNAVAVSAGKVRRKSRIDTTTGQSLPTTDQHRTRRVTATHSGPAAFSAASSTPTTTTNPQEHR